MIQHARLILFRHFSDSSQLNLSHKFRRFCLKSSIRVAIKTAWMLRRARQNPEFDDEFGVVTDDLVHLHIFRVAVLLLFEQHKWAATGRTGGLSTIQGWNEYGAVELEDGIKASVMALQVIAVVHITGRR